MSLFAGRTDVYAKRFVHKRTGRAGYAPLCENEWVRGVCEKPKIKCGKCPSRKLLALTNHALYEHLRGKRPLGQDVIGVYPMLEDETCWFIVANFDDENWMNDIRTFRTICKQYGLDVPMERSRSGNGGHVWFFFAESVACALARRMVSGLLTAAMEQRHDLSFGSYDRLIPNQDTMPKGGFGNLIALPLQGLARKPGHSEFVNDELISYPDQWAYLTSIQPIPLIVIENLAAQLNKNGELGLLAHAEDESGQPWAKKTVPPPLCENDFPKHMKLVRANGIYLPKKGCSERALNRVKCLAAFKNPEFYKAQAMRLPTYDKPRIICNAWEARDYLCIPRGLENDLLTLAENAGAVCSVQDKTEHGKSIKVAFNGELRTEQRAAAEALLEHNNGVLAATTAFGKTVTAAYIIGQRKMNTLVLVHTQALMNQ